MPRPESKTLQQIEQELEVKVDKRAAEKEFEIARSPEGLYFIRFNAGGEVPDALKGRWTNTLKAEGAIANYKFQQEEQLKLPGHEQVSS